MDDAKNMALLFFMDHLMQKNGRRTIHDLSCQFGARGFSPEMREAVGTTQEGLTEFLQAHPSLFTVEGDQVILKGFGEIDGKNHLMKMPATGRNRDYEREAVEFFEQKLQKFGPELLIKSLLGHRSQAAPEVRVISGRHLKEFTEFLSSQVDHFVVEGDRVRLKNMPEPSEEAVELDDEGQPLAGVKAKQAAVEYLKSVLEQNEDAPVPLEAFYKKFCDRFPHSVRQEVATNPKELLAFLKLNRNIFFIRSNRVSLVKIRPEDGSESGRSTDSADSTSNLTDNNNTLFPLNMQNIHRIHFVKALKQAQEVVSMIVADLDAQSEKFIGIDFKLVTLAGQSDEYLSLIVVASQSRIAVFDLMHSASILLESGLKDLLESDSVLKVMHDIKRVANVLAHQYSTNMRKVFDTQIAHAVIQHEKFGKAFSDLRAISFLNLQRVYYPQSIMMSDVSPRRLSQTIQWSLRPVTDEMLLAASEECHTLVSALFRLLNSQLPVHAHTMFEDRCFEALMPSANRPPPQIHGNISSLMQNGVYKPPQRRSNGVSSPKQLPVQSNGYQSPPPPPLPEKPKMVDSSTQTFSTGEIQCLNCADCAYHDSTLPYACQIFYCLITAEYN
uniref:3'-5' exonuclease domain-containing protein n=1 Tax=Panagrolaimus sp. JU765 TaxID=591449 RepID=A0AC34Q737_9BILA